MAVNEYSVVTTQNNRVYELRTYTAAEGRLPNLLTRFGGGEIELFHRAGMNSIGYWVPDDPRLSNNTMITCWRMTAVKLRLNPGRSSGPILTGRQCVPRQRQTDAS